MRLILIYLTIQNISLFLQICIKHFTLYPRVLSIMSNVDYFCNFLELKYISDMHSQTLKRQAEDISFNNGMYIVQSETSF